MSAITHVGIGAAAVAAVMLFAFLPAIVTHFPVAGVLLVVVLVAVVVKTKAWKP